MERFANGGLASGGARGRAIIKRSFGLNKLGLDVFNEIISLECTSF